MKILPFFLTLIALCLSEDCGKETCGEGHNCRVIFGESLCVAEHCEETLLPKISKDCKANVYIDGESGCPTVDIDCSDSEEEDQDEKGMPACRIFDAPVVPPGCQLDSKDGPDGCPTMNVICPCKDMTCDEGSECRIILDKGECVKTTCPPVTLGAEPLIQDAICTVTRVVDDNGCPSVEHSCIGADQQIPCPLFSAPFVQEGCHMESEMDENGCPIIKILCPACENVTCEEGTDCRTILGKTECVSSICMPHMDNGHLNDPMCNVTRVTGDDGCPVVLTTCAEEVPDSETCETMQCTPEEECRSYINVPALCVDKSCGELTAPIVEPPCLPVLVPESDGKCPSYDIVCKDPIHRISMPGTDFNTDEEDETEVNIDEVDCPPPVRPEVEPPCLPVLKKGENGECPTYEVECNPQAKERTD